MIETLGLGRYQLEEQIGAGASARVFRAVDTELKRTVAVKVLHEHLCRQPNVPQRFRREAEAVAALEHPNIVHIHDVAPAGSEQFFFVSEYVDGGNLADWLALEGGRLPHEIAISVAIQALGGLEAAHCAGIIHRDLKPDNLMISGDGHVKIADFGVAFRDDAGSITQEGNLLGSPSYMSPEQIEGGAVDARSDLFSFGSLFYEMVSGVKPYGDGQVVQILTRIANAAHTPIAEVETTLDPRLAALIEGCLAFDPADRPASAGILREALQKLARARRLNDPAEEIAAFRKGAEAERKKRSYAVVDSLVEEAKGLLEPGRDPALAISLIDRALALQPFHFEAYRLLEMTGKVKRKRLGGVVVTIFVLSVLIIGGYQLLTLYRKTDTVSPPTELRAPAPVAEAIPDPAPVERPVVREAQPRQRELTRQAPPKTAAKPAVLPSGTLKIATRPWAEVYVDGKYLGKTPLLRELQLAPGEHKLRLRNPHAELVEQTIEVRSGETLTRFVELPILAALLRLTLAPGDEVWVDNEALGHNGKGDPIEIRHGQRTLTFRNEGRTQTVEIDALAGRLVELRSPFLEP